VKSNQLASLESCLRPLPGATVQYSLIFKGTRLNRWTKGFGKTVQVAYLHDVALLQFCNFLRIEAEFGQDLFGLFAELRRAPPFCWACSGRRADRPHNDVLIVSEFDRMVRTITQCLPADVEASRRHGAEVYEA